MPIFISQGHYTQHALKGMIATPEDREAAVARMYEKAGGKLLAYYVTFGAYDWLVIGELPDEKAVGAITATVGAGGGVAGISTMLAMTSSAAMEAFALAETLSPSFKNAGLRAEDVWSG